MPLRSQATSRLILEEFNTRTYVAPAGASSPTLTANAAPWTFGAKVEYIAAGAILTTFHARSLTIGDADTNADYQVGVFAGLAGAEVEISRVHYIRSSVQNRSSYITFNSVELPAATRVSCAVMASVGGALLRATLDYHMH